MSVAHDPLHVEVDVPSLSRVDTQGKPHGVRTTLGDTLGVVCFLWTASRTNLLYMYNEQCMTGKVCVTLSNVKKTYSTNVPTVFTSLC